MADLARRPRVLSGIQPTADSFHLGNYLGATEPKKARAVSSATLARAYENVGFVSPALRD